jgi:lipoate-protein ligase A
VICFRNENTDARYNIGLEEKIFEEFNGNDEFFMLWRNDKSVIVGYNQIIEQEVDLEFARLHNIPVIRRKTGGGAVYHDLGNVNYTYISNKANEFGNFLAFAGQILEFLRSRGVNAQHIGKNDVGIEGKKISGSAQRVRNGYILHHGTLMFDVDIEMLDMVLTPAPGKLCSKGIKSARSRVCNISEYLQMGRKQFWEEICDYFKCNRDVSGFSLSL